MPRPAPWPPRVYERRGVEYARVYLGPRQYAERALGPAGSQEAREAYARLVAELAACGRTPPPERGPGVTVAEVAVAYLQHAKGYHEYRTFHRIRTALRAARALYGATPAADFGPLALQAVRESFVAEGLSRGYVNHLADCLRWAWRWAASREMVGGEVARALDAVPSLRQGKGPAPEAPRVRAADPGQVERTLPFLVPTVADMVRLQLCTGARPGEVCALRPADLVRPWRTVEGVEMWLYVMDEHKTGWRGGPRWLPLGPKAQAVLASYLGRPPEDYCFCPRESAERWLRENGRRVRLRRARAPGECYDTQAYDRAVRAGCRRAGTRWSPNQLRHLVGTVVETEYGREDARCVLGHSSPQTTAVYAEWTERAARVLARLG